MRDGENNVIKIDTEMKYQTIIGWGTSLAWWGKLVGEWSDEKRKEILELAFHKKNGLGLNLVRYNIGGSKSKNDMNLRYGADIESFLLEDGTYDWSKDKGQRYILNEAKKIIEKGGDAFISEAFSNSPPYFMTKNGYVSGAKDGGSNLKDEEYENFVSYLVNVLKHFRDEWNIKFDTIDPLNEPSSNWWKEGNIQEGCAFKLPSEKDRIYGLLKKELYDKKLSTKISGFDETSIDETINTINNASDETIDLIDQINTHEYAGRKRLELRYLAKSLGKTLYMNEMCCSGGASHNHDDMDNGLKLAQYIFSDLRDMKVPAWYIWQVVDDEDMNIKNNSNWGLISAHWSGENKEKYYVTKQYYAMAHFSRFIRPGYEIVYSSDFDTVAAVDENDDRLVIVIKNDEVFSKEISFDISSKNTDSLSISPLKVCGYRTSASENLEEVKGLEIESGILNDKLPGKSIVTYVICKN
ncbi:MAG: glycoside hydrolase [Clostridium sp.]|nr:glycoside hydrolase [Clostridium sp.]